ncbi:hypothetical protein D3C81_1898240 [compost metagenome]
MQVLVGYDLVPHYLQCRTGHEVVTHGHDAVGCHGVAFPLPAQVLDHGLCDVLVTRLELEQARAEVELVGVPVQRPQTTPEVPQLGVRIVYRIE